MRFETACFHPNVDTYGNICLDILKDKWSGAWRRGRSAPAARACALHGQVAFCWTWQPAAACSAPCACPSCCPSTAHSLMPACPCAPRFLPAAAYSVKTILQSIQSLLADPNVDSPLNVHAAKLWGVNDAEYRTLVMKTYNQPRAS